MTRAAKAALRKSMLCKVRVNPNQSLVSPKILPAQSHVPIAATPNRPDFNPLAYPVGDASFDLAWPKHINVDFRE